jgi:hypothetical protein
MVWQVLWLLIVGFALPFGMVQAAPVIAKDGETVELDGTISVLEGLDTDERPIVYIGLRLDSPVTFTDGLDEKDNLGVVRLLPPERDFEALRKYGGMRVRVKGKVLYRWYGPSAAPLSTMLVVEEITAVPR